MQDVDTLVAKVKTIQLQPAQLANGAVELMNEVANSKITGEEDRYSHTDLSDFEGNLSGSEKAFALLIPALRQTGNGKLADTISARFAAVQKTLEPLQAQHRAGVRALHPADPGRSQEVRGRGRRARRAAVDGRRQGQRRVRRIAPALLRRRCAALAVLAIALAMAAPARARASRRRIRPRRARWRCWR